MDMKNERSNLNLTSNIMLKSKYERDQWAFIPADMLPSYYADVRASQFLSPSQRKQMQKKLFYADRIVDK